MLRAVGIGACAVHWLVTGSYISCVADGRGPEVFVRWVPPMAWTLPCKTTRLSKYRAVGGAGYQDHGEAHAGLCGTPLIAYPSSARSGHTLSSSAAAGDRTALGTKSHYARVSQLSLCLSHRSAASQNGTLADGCFHYQRNSEGASALATERVSRSESMFAHRLLATAGTPYCGRSPKDLCHVTRSDERKQSSCLRRDARAPWRRLQLARDGERLR
jgi:hypothetical protein